MAEALFSRALDVHFSELRSKLVVEYDALLANAFHELCVEVSALHQENLKRCRQDGCAAPFSQGCPRREPSKEAPVPTTTGVSTHELPPPMNCVSTHELPPPMLPDEASTGSAPESQMDHGQTSTKRPQEGMVDRYSSADIMSASSMTSGMPAAPPEAEREMIAGESEDFCRGPRASHLQLPRGSSIGSAGGTKEVCDDKDEQKERAIRIAIPGCPQTEASKKKKSEGLIRVPSPAEPEQSFTSIANHSEYDEDDEVPRTGRKSHVKTRSSNARESRKSRPSLQTSSSKHSYQSSASSIFHMGRHQSTASTLQHIWHSLPEAFGFSGFGKKSRTGGSTRVVPSSLLSVLSTPRQSNAPVRSVVPSLCGSSSHHASDNYSRLDFRLYNSVGSDMVTCSAPTPRGSPFLHTNSSAGSSDSASRVVLDNGHMSSPGLRSSFAAHSVESRFFMRPADSIELSAQRNLFAQSSQMSSEAQKSHAIQSSHPNSSMGLMSAPNVSHVDFEFEVHPIWRKKKMITLQMQATATDVPLNHDDSDSDSEDGESQKHQKMSWFDKKLRRFTVMPMSKTRVIWDLFGCLFVGYDFVITPLQFLEPPPSKWVYAINWIVRIFWSLDLPLSFMTAYSLPVGTVERRPTKIWARYARTWMAFDVTIVVFDWLELLLISDQGFKAARVGKTMKITRLLRMVRLLRLIRLVKMPDILSQFIYHLQSERLIIMIGIIKIMIFLVAVAHLIACTWYGIGTMDENQNWIVAHGLDGAELEYRYMTSFHWSLTQFAGAMEVNPQNFVERFFSVLALLFGFLVSSSAVSTITSSMTRLQIVSARQSTQVAILNQYLADNGISTKVALRVQRNAVYAVSQEKRNTPESSIELLQLVSEPLRVELHYEIYCPILEWYPFFRHYDNANKNGMKRVCHGAVKRLALSRGDVLFSTGEMPPCPVMYFICTGKLQYQRQGFSPETLLSGHRVCEVVLWTTWVHCGLLRAKSDSNLLVLDATQFQATAVQYQTNECYAKKFAQAFVKELNKCEKSCLTDLEHLGFSVEDVCMQVFHIKRSVAQFVSVTQ